MDSTRRPLDTTQRLPPELLLRVFDFFAHGDSPRAFVRGPGRVCARWRRLAFAHPSFYKDIWLSRNLSTSALGLFNAQLDAGGNADVEITIVHPEEIESVLPLLVRHLGRCAGLHVEYFGQPREVRGLLRALASAAAPRLRRLHLRVEPVVSEEDEEPAEPVVFPADIFQGEAPRLARLELCGAVCMMLPPLASPAIPAFRTVESLEVHAYAFGPPAVARALAAAPHTRCLEVLAVKHGTGPWPLVHIPPTLKLHLEKVLFSALDGAWDQLLSALDVYASVSEFAALCGMPARHLAAYAARSLPAPAPLHLAVVDSARLGVQHTDLVLSAPSLTRSLRLVDALGAARLAQYSNRIVRLEVPSTSSSWPDLRLPQLQTLVLHVGADRLRPAGSPAALHCPKLRELALFMGKRAPPEAFRVKADHVAYFVRDRLGVDAEGRVAVSVRRPLVLVGRRSWLVATVGSVSEV